MDLIARPSYLNKLKETQRTDFIKVLVGMRRCGKSCLLLLFADYLRQSGVPATNIATINFESAEYLHVNNMQTFLSAIEGIKTQSSPDYPLYLLLDEVQLVPGWERAINALRLDEQCDIYLTGSNAYLLSSQLATMLSGRALEIPVYPLSFKEFLDFTHWPASLEAAFEQYATFGGLPPVVLQGNNTALASTILSGIYNTVFAKDIARHVQVRNTLVFDDIAAYLADTSGSPVSITNIEKRLASVHRKTASETIEKYMQALIDAFLFYRVRRFDLRGGERLQGLEKYYPSDLGIKRMLLGFPRRDYGFTLENAVFCELNRRGLGVTVGKNGQAEVDFVANDGGANTYIQVSVSLLDPATRSRELAAFEGLKESHAQKLVLTLDRVGLGAVGDAQIKNALDWMLED